MTKRRFNRRSSRRSFLRQGFATPILLAGITRLDDGPTTPGRAQGRSSQPGTVELDSPDGGLQFLISHRDHQLTYRLLLKRQPVVEASRVGISIDGADLGMRAEIRRVERYQLRERYPSRGVHSVAVNHCKGARVSLRHVETDTSYILEVRAFDDGIAFRFVIPGDRRRVPDEATEFVIPTGSTVWYHDFEGHYEGIHAAKEISEVKIGEWAAPPLTFRLPDRAGYGSITEAALINYAGLALEAGGNRTFKARLGHAAPVSYPFRLRYGVEEGQRLAAPAAISGTITTPWRVVMAASDLNRLVNSDIISNVSPPPDPRVFPNGPNTAWIKPGRCVWRYLDGGETTLEAMKEFSRLAGELGFEYNLIEGFWRRWSESDLRELVDYSKARGVGIWLWQHRRDIWDREVRRKFFKHCHDLGVAGVKLDFFDHEAKEVIDLYQASLADAAEFKLMVNFHGANKPAGESRTWPNEMTREGIRGLEYRRTEAWARHNTTIPFTRLLAGHADYTAVHFGERRRETSWTHQIASAAILTSPLLIYGAHPNSLLGNPAVDIIKSIPSTWDETIALPVSEIGQIAAFARRKGDNWFLAIMNGPDARTVRIPLSFLNGGKFQAMLVRDRKDDAAAVEIDNATVSRAESLAIEMRAGGGFIARFSKGLERPDA